jgi:DNA-directed RNA polymerase subunit RPC12/RpoP
MKKSKDVQIEKVKTKLKALDLNCPQCNHRVQAEDININNTLAKCTNCNSLLFLDNDDEFFKKVKNRRAGRPETIIPEGTEILTLPSSLDIRINWFKSSNRSTLIFMSIFTIMWNIMLMPIAIGMVSNGNFGSLLPLSLHLAAGILLFYQTLKMYINYTDVYITKESITIGQKPLKTPFSKDKVFSTVDIAQLYVSKYMTGSTNGQTNYAYALYAITQKGQKEKLVDGMNKETQLYLEQEIESYLEIEDKAVRGEIVT